MLCVVLFWAPADGTATKVDGTVLALDNSLKALKSKLPLES